MIIGLIIGVIIVVVIGGFCRWLWNQGYAHGWHDRGYTLVHPMESGRRVVNPQETEEQ